MISSINKFIRVLSFFVILFVISCTKQSNTEKYKVLKINTDKSSENIKLSQITNNFKFIKLYTDSLFLIGDIRNIVYKNKIYVQNFQKILVFFPNGSPAYAVNKQGRAGAEYYEINDFHVDTNNNIIEIWDKVRRKLLIFNDNNGRFIKSYKIDIDAYYFKKIKQDYFFYSSGCYLKQGKSTARIFSVNKKGNINNSFLESDYINLYSFSTPAFLSVNNGCVFYDDAPLSEIYKINNNEIELVYKFDINNNTITKGEYLSLRNLRASDRLNQLRRKYNYSIGQTNVNKYCIKFEIMAKSKWYIGFYNIKSNNYYIANNIIEDSILKIPVWYKNICNDKLISYIPSYKILNSNVNYEPLVKTNPEIYKIIKSIHKFDNPIVIISNLKEF